MKVKDLILELQKFNQDENVLIDNVVENWVCDIDHIENENGVKIVIVPVTCDNFCTHEDPNQPCNK